MSELPPLDTIQVKLPAKQKTTERIHKTCRRCGQENVPHYIRRKGRQAGQAREACCQCTARQLKKCAHETPEERSIRSKKNRGRDREGLRKWQQENRERTNELARLRNRRLKRLCFDHYGGICQCPGCSEDRIEFLTIDHIDGGGNKHRKEAGINSGTQLYQWLKNHDWPEGYRVLCYNCNNSYGHFGYCPHQQQPKEGFDDC